MKKSVLVAVKANALPGESAWVAAQRCLIREALVVTGGSGKEAAQILGITPRKMCFWRRRFGFGKGQVEYIKNSPCLEAEPAVPSSQGE